LSNLGSEICVSLIVIINIELISTDVISNSSISIAVTIPTSSIVYIYYLLANNTLRISLVSIRALADASIVQENQRTLTLQASRGFRRRTLLASGVTANTFFAICGVTRGTLREAFGTKQEARETRLASVDSGHTCCARCFARGTLEIHTSETIITATHALRFREKRIVAALFTGKAVSCRVCTSLTVAITLYTVIRRIRVVGVRARTIAPTLEEVLE